MAGTQRDKIQQMLGRIEFSKPVLDVGAGPGFLEETVSATAMDTDISYLKKFYGPRVLASGDCLPFADSSFATVFCIDTVHLLKNVRELSRVLKSSGRLIVSLPCNRWNCDVKLKVLKEKFPALKLIQSFIVRTETEWDAVAVFAKAQSSRKSRTAR